MGNPGIEIKIEKIQETIVMKPCQTLYKESTQERGKKRTKGNDQSPSKQTTQMKRCFNLEEREPLRIKPFSNQLKHIN
jgi:hypothetical protein